MIRVVGRGGSISKSKLADVLAATSHYDIPTEAVLTILLNGGADDDAERQRIHQTWIDYSDGAQLASCVICRYEREGVECDCYAAQRVAAGDQALQGADAGASPLLESVP